MSQTGPLFVSSGDLVADRRYKWALDCAAKGDFAGAADILAQTVELAPGFATAWFALGAIRDRLGDRAGAALAFEHTRKLDAEDYHGARLQLALVGAAEAPLAASGLATNAFALTARTAELHNANLMSDVDCALRFARAALEASAANVAVNHRYIKDAAVVAEQRDRLQAIEDAARASEARAAELVLSL